MAGQIVRNRCKNCGGTKIQVIVKGRYAWAEYCESCYAECRKCDGVGYLFELDEEGREHAIPCECRDLDYRISLFNNAQIPGQFYDATFENFDVSRDPSLEEALRTATFLPITIPTAREKEKDCCSWEALALVKPGWSVPF